MITCLIAPFLEAHFPDPVASSARGLFDVIPAVSELSLAEIGGLEPTATWAFGPRLNVVRGISGSGKTRVLEALKQKADSAVSLANPRRCDFTTMSSGQQVWALSEILLEVQPAGTCLLMDDVFDHLSEKTQLQLCDILRGHKEQVVMTMKNHFGEAVTNALRRADARFVSLALPGRTQT